MRVEETEKKIKEPLITRPLTAEEFKDAVKKATLAIVLKRFEKEEESKLSKMSKSEALRPAPKAIATTKQEKPKINSPPV